MDNLFSSSIWVVTFDERKCRLMNMQKLGTDLNLIIWT